MKWRPIHLVALLPVLYTLLYWRYSHIFDVDHGRWMYEVYRHSLGDKLYTEVPWQYPPLALWLYGSIARLFGPEIGTLYSVSAAIYAGLAMGTFVWFRAWISPGLLVPALGAIFFATAFRGVHLGGAPIPTGMYSPAQPLGALLLLISALFWLRHNGEGKARWALLTGLFAGLTFVTKQDFWGAACLLIPATIVSLSPTTRWRWRSGAIALLAFVLVVGLASNFVYQYGGVLAWRVMLTGFSQAGLGQFHITPQILWIQSVCAGIILGAICALEWKRKSRAVLVSAVILLPVLAWNARAFAEYFIPIALFPLLLILWARSRWKAPDSELFRRVLFLTLLCFSCRLRRGFESYDWFFPLFDFPLIAVAVSAFAKRVTDSELRWGYAFIGVLFAACAFKNHSILKIETVQTAHGKLRTKSAQAETFRTLVSVLKRVDPDGKRPLLPLPYQSLNYTTGRLNPTKLTQGFAMSLEKVEGNLAHVASVKPLILISEGLRRRVPDHHRDAYLPGDPVQDVDYSGLLALYESPSDANRAGPWQLYIPREAPSPDVAAAR